MAGSEELFQKAMNEGHSAAWDQTWDVAVQAPEFCLVVGHLLAIRAVVVVELPDAVHLVVIEAGGKAAIIRRERLIL